MELTGRQAGAAAACCQSVDTASADSLPAATAVAKDDRDCYHTALA